MLERTADGLRQCISDLETENTELRDQLASALETATTKSEPASLGSCSEFSGGKSAGSCSSCGDTAVTRGSSGVWSVADSEELECEVKLLGEDGHGGAVQLLQARLARAEESCGLLVAACYISWAMHHARSGPRPGRAVTLLSDEHRGTSEVPGDVTDADLTPALELRDQLHSEVTQLQQLRDQLGREVSQLEAARQQLGEAEESRRLVTRLEERLVGLAGEATTARQEAAALHSELDTLRARDLGSRAHAEQLQRVIADIEQELGNADFISQSRAQAWNLREKIRYLVDSESKYSESVTKHEERETAFRATLAEADIIMTNIENDYKTRLADLEAERGHLRGQLTHASHAADFIRQHLPATAADQTRDLVEKLFEKEKSELAFMDKIFKLENTINQLSQKANDKEILKNELNDSIKDQEETFAQIQNLRKENKELLDEIVHKKEVEFRCAELQQTEGYLRARVEELELAEAGMREALAGLEARAGARERRLGEEVRRLREEVTCHVAAPTCDEEGGQTGENLRLECDAVKEKLREMTAQLEEKCKLFQDTEASLRTEVGSL